MTFSMMRVSGRPSLEHAIDVKSRLDRCRRTVIPRSPTERSPILWKTLAKRAGCPRAGITGWWRSGAPSAIMADKLIATPKKRIRAAVGHLDDRSMRALDTAIILMLGLAN
jgi:hypothetical protein